MTHLPSWAVPGRKVVCVDDQNPHQWMWRGDKPIKNEIYTLDRVVLGPNGRIGCFISELYNVNPWGYLLTRFRPVVTLEEDMLTFRSMIATTDAPTDMELT